MRFVATVPVLRAFDRDATRRFYCEWLGMSIDWEHVFEPGMPVYAQLSRGDLVLHLSEHHGDATPGSHVRIRMEGLEAFHAELAARPYANMRPGIETPEWGGREVSLIDPSMNRLTFYDFG